MPTNFMPSSDEYFRILPELILTCVGVLIMFLEALRKEGQKSIAGGLSSCRSPLRPRARSDLGRAR